MGERGKKVAVDAYYNEAVEKSDKTLLMCNFDRISAVKILLKYQLFQKLWLIVFSFFLRLTTILLAVLRLAVNLIETLEHGKGHEPCASPGW